MWLTLKPNMKKKIVNKDSNCLKRLKLGRKRSKRNFNETKPRQLRNSD